MLFAVAVVFCAAGAVRAAELGAFEVREPLGQTWAEEWLTAEVELTGAGGVAAEGLVVWQGGAQVPAQFYEVATGRALAGALGERAKVKVLFRATIPARQAVRFRVEAGKRQWAGVTVGEAGGVTTVGNGVYALTFDAARPLPINGIGPATRPGAAGAFAWPAGVEATGVTDEWMEQGPARAVLKRTFRFADAAKRYEVVLDVRAGDPWLDVTDTYAMGKGTAITLDLRPLNADVVYHPHAYNARTFKADGKEEDSTLQPPQHPVATLGPVWRDIWFGGGPFAFVYDGRGDFGVGLAAVRGSEWTSPADVSLVSQNFDVNGDADRPGRVSVRIPTDGGHRRWALVMGPPAVRKAMGRLVRSRADIPLERVLREWVLEWESAAPAAKAGAAGNYLGGYFNQHFFNPTTFPRTVQRQIPKAGPVKSRELAVLAYVFSDPNYWPGPAYRWPVGNPNFHTDMYNVVLRIGLLMPDHPHAKRWVQFGIDETKRNLYGDSFPGGAWAESLGYSAFFFHVADLGQMLKEHGQVDALREWPRFKEVATYLAVMHTPVDPRYGSRQKAPIGDTHPGNYVKELRALAAHYRGVDDAFAEQLARFPEKWEGALDLSSREFHGFGAALRGNAYDERNESFVSVKAGPARNHYQGDELSFHFAAMGTPLAIDHACHYSPRPWSASIHNRPDMNGERPVGVAVRRAYATSTAADVFVADERTTRVNQVPMEPHLAVKPGWEYPTRTLGRPWTMRRYAMLVKHDPAASRVPDYLVLRDEIDSPETPWWNLHVLARDVKVQGQRASFPGQLDVDLTAHFVTPAVGEVERREWGWRDVDSPLLRNTKGAEYEQKYFGAYVPENFERGTWGQAKGTGGEMTKWLRVKGATGRSQWLVVLMPNLKGRAPAKVEKVSETSVRVTLGEEVEVIHLGSEGAMQAAIERGGKVTTLLKAGEVKGWDELPFEGFAPNVDRGGR